MAAVRRRRADHWLLMQARRFGFGRNPLRRRVDRIESVIVLGAVLASLLVVPGAAALGTAVRNAGEASAAQRRVGLTEVQARALDDTVLADPGLPAVLRVPVRVGWTDPNGWPREGTAYAPAGTRKGTELTIWMDAAGTIVTPPRSPDDSSAIGVGAGVSAVLVGWLLVFGLARLLLVPLNRRRSREWEREWAQVAPRWRHPHG
ncbi:hypothetical protein ACIBL3_21520 [Kribbella sp. NPDC050124]|uniref:Rv1733c family protein n=1 Tax=Kribbella sp. NPDC050124 TaxID=3364114 RepID=UPI003791CC5C